MNTDLVVKEGRVSATVTQEIACLKNGHGLIMPSVVVDAARKTSSPLHKYFEWDDGEAAERYRLIQAQCLIRACVTYLDDGKDKTPIRAFVSLRDDRVLNGGYRTIIEVLSDPRFNEKLLQDALFELHVFQEKYRRIRELSPVFAAVEKVNRKLGANK